MANVIASVDPFRLGIKLGRMVSDDDQITDEPCSPLVPREG